MASQKLSEAVTKALELLDKLENRSEEWDGESLQPGIIKYSQALQFTFSSKTGLGLSWSSGFGFAIKKLQRHEDGTAEWSAPAFSTFHAAGAGATLGRQTTQSLHAIISDRAVNKLESGGFDLLVGGDLNLTTPQIAGKQGSLVSGQFNVLDADSDVLVLGHSEGVLLDASIAVGGLSEDTALNKEVYGGAEATAEAILSGELPRPVEFRALYDRLNAIAQKAQ